MAEEGSEVVVPEETAIAMGRHLVETHRIEGLNPAITARLRSQIAKVVMSQWGVRTPRFTADGGGWIVDLSDVTGDVVFGIVRSTGEGRVLTELVSEETAEALLKGTPKGMPQKDEGTPGAQGEHQNMQPERTLTQKQPDPNEPRLIVYQEPEDGSGSTETKVIRTTYADAQKQVLPLIMRGCSVEVWSVKKVPSIKVDL